MKVSFLNRVKVLSVFVFLLTNLSIFGYAEKFQRPLNVIIMESMTLKPVQDRAELLMKHISDQYGLKPGVHVQYTRINAKGEVNTGVVKLHETMDIIKPDLVVSIATVGSVAAKKVLEKTNVPQLFFFVSDPVKAGLVTSFDSEHDNISGISHMVNPHAKLSMISKLLKSIDENRVFNIALLNTTYPSEVSEKEDMFAALPSYPNINMIDVQIEYMPENTTAMVAEYKKRLKKEGKKTSIDFLWAAAGPNSHKPEFLLNVKDKVKKDFIIVSQPEVVKKGGVLSFDSTAEGDVKNISEYVHKSLNGEMVSHMPVRYTDGYEVSLNLKTAKEHNMIIPLDIMKLAKGRIYQ